MRVVVITGSTRGIGFGLAEAFLARGCRVVVSGRTEEGVAEAVTLLSAGQDSERIFGQPCDISQPEQLPALWDGAVGRFGRIDIWINNAGLAHPQTPFWRHDPEEIATVVHTNLVGSLLGARVALKGMLAQGFGALYNMEGLGSGGRRVEGLTLYGTTKAGLAYLTDNLAQEVAGTPVIVGALRPGMVVTELLTDQYEERPEEWERAKRIFNILADRVETVTPWLADRILANQKNGVRFTWLTRGRIFGRFLAAPFRKRDIVT